VRHVVIDHHDTRIVHVVQHPLAKRADAHDAGGVHEQAVGERDIGSCIPGKGSKLGNGRKRRKMGRCGKLDKVRIFFALKTSKPS
jgi:hypothetical protein